MLKDLFADDITHRVHNKGKMNQSCIFPLWTERPAKFTNL